MMNHDMIIMIIVIREAGTREEKSKDSGMSELNWFIIKSLKYPEYLKNTAFSSQVKIASVTRTSGRI